jgi:hypothetical protein
MDGFPGDMTAEDIEKKLMDDLKAQLASASGDRQIVIDAATAAMLLQKLGGDEPTTEPPA